MKIALVLALIAAHPAFAATAPTPQPTQQPTKQQPPQLLPTKSLICTPTDQSATSYWIRVVEQPGAMSAMLLFQTPPTGRGALAGYADVSSVPTQDSATALELKNTDPSPFQFDLTVTTQKNSNGWREATLVGAELFGGGSLVGVPYQCRVSND